MIPLDYPPVLLLAAAVLLLGSLYLWRVNSLILQVQPDALALAGERWTIPAIDEAYRKAREEPVDLLKHFPPKTGNRYIVVGGNGMLGGWIVLHLLQRGEDPSHIRILDNRAASRTDLLKGPASKVQFIQVDITDPAATTAAFLAPWPKPHISTAPLTVFHTAAVMRFFERAKFLIPKNARVNVDGTRNSLQAAKEANASYFIYTSSGSVPMHSVQLWPYPWQSRIKGIFQVVHDDTKLAVKHTDFISNYSYTKSIGDELVRKGHRSITASGREIKTGVLRPGSMIYGIGDQAVTVYLRNEVNPSWVHDIDSTHIYVENASIAHLFYEAALIRNESTKGHSPDVGGKAFLVTDSPRATRFGDIYMGITHSTNGTTKFPRVPPVIFLYISQFVALYHITYNLLLLVPILGWFTRKILPSLEGNQLINVQPGLFQSSSIHVIYDDRPARRSVEEGGIGYRPPFTTIGGLAKVLYQYNTAKGEK